MILQKREELKKAGLLVFIFLFSISGVFAQVMPQTKHATKVTDGELNQFVSAYVKIQSISQQSHKKVVNAVQKQGMEMQKFSEIYKAQRNPKNQKVNATKKELRKFAAAKKAITQIQNQAREKMQKAIIDSKLTVQRYREILLAIQKNPQLQQKFRKLFKGNK